MEGILKLIQEDEQFITSYSFVTIDGTDTYAVLRTSRNRDTIEICNTTGIRYIEYNRVKSLVPYVEIDKKLYRVVRNMEMGKDILFADIDTKVEGYITTHFTPAFPGDNVTIIDTSFSNKMKVTGDEFRIVEYDAKTKRFLIIKNDKSFKMYRNQIGLVNKSNTLEVFVITQLEEGVV